MRMLEGNQLDVAWRSSVSVDRERVLDPVRRIDKYNL
jgi:hypothetical protein